MRLTTDNVLKGLSQFTEMTVDLNDTMFFIIIVGNFIFDKSLIFFLLTTFPRKAVERVKNEDILNSSVEWCGKVG